MAKTNPQIRTEALAALKGKWGDAIILFVIYMVATMLIAFIPVINFVSFLVALPLTYGCSIWFLKFIRSTDGSAPSIQSLFDGFGDYVRVLLTMLLVNIYTFLWGLLLVVPGIIKGLSYAMTPYILNDHPELKNNSAIELSMAMMKGYKLKLFLMALNFAFWSFLCIFTLGIGLLWVAPYMQTTMASFYEDVKVDYLSKAAATTL